MPDPPESDAPADCPLCQDQSVALVPRPRIGRTFEECWRCGRRVVLPGVTEWDFHDPLARRRIIAARVSFAFGVGFAVPLVYLLVTLTTARYWNVLEALLGLAAGWLALGLLETVRLSGEINRSRRRVTRDPMYQARLIEYGITESRTRRVAVETPSGEGLPR